MILDLTAEQREAYDLLWSSRLEVFVNEERPISAALLLSVITRLKQLCNFEPQTGRSSKLEALTTLIESMGEASDKLVVFSQYVQTLKWLGLQMSLTNYELYHGGLTLAERDAMVQRFEREPGPRILLVSLRAGGLGLNLNSASVVVLFDRWWNPAVEMQAIHRAHRFDRKAPLHVVRFLVGETIEERIQHILEAKQVLFDEYVEGAPGVDVQPFTRAEFARILDLQPSEVN